MQKIPEEKLVAIEKLASQGKTDQAKELFQKLIDENPEHLRLRVVFADFLLSIGDVSFALNILRQGMQIDSQNFDVRYLFGIAQTKASRFNLAQKEFEFLQTLRPASLEIKKQLGWVKIMKGELEQGRKLLREVISAEMTNPTPYLDLGVSFMGSLDFEEALRWLETAKHLNPKDPLISESIAKAKESQVEFEKFSVEDKEKARQARNEPQFLKEEAVKQTLLFATQGKPTKEDMEDIKKEFELAGFNPDFGTFSRPALQPASQTEKEAIEYLQYHQKVPNVERKITQEEFKYLKENLLNPKLPPEETKIILIALGHQGTKEAIALLKTYYQKAPKPLKTFVKMALEECEIFSQENHSKFIPFSI